MTRTYRLAMVTRIHLPEAAAASFRLAGVERALRDAGHRVTVLTTQVPGKTPKDIAGVIVKRWPVLRDKSGYVRGYIQYMSFDIPAFFRILALGPTDAALIEPPPTTGVVSRVACAIRRIPYVWYAPDVWSDAAASTSAPRPVVRAVRAMESFAMRGAQAVIAINDGVAERAKALGARDIRIIPNGIDTDVFRADREPLSTEQWAALTGEKVSEVPPFLLYAGTASEWQGAGIFVDAFHRIHEDFPQARLVFLGQGSDWETIRHQAQQFEWVGDNPVTVASGVPVEAAAQWQRTARACLVSIIPGQGYDFAYPTKIFASLACGTPIIYAGVGPAVDDISTHDLGYVSSYEVRDVAQAMSKMLSDVSEGSQTEHYRSWVVAHRSLQATGQRVRDVLEEVAARTRL
ncbi:glycosyltransferase [Actinomyces vulturis]|uniref:glycosyltransferase n=1 Tax=Actinomyces vulturis TaxID=1857645 RepID=UPI0008296BD4|nr:glycosyltransferase [Actinomyces vulturis]